MNTRTFFFALLLLASIGMDTARAAPAADVRTLGREIETVLLGLGDRGALGSSDRPLTVSAPAQIRHELGAVVDARAAGGPTVLAVTPGSAAERLGLRPGDRLVAINGRRLAGNTLAGNADPVTALEDAVRAGNGSLQIETLRDGQSLQLSGAADVSAIPAYQLVVGAPGDAGCGHVTDTAGPLPRSRQVYRAEITRIDGRSTPLAPKPRHRLDAGRHVLTVRELIDRSWLSSPQIVRIARMQRHEDARAYKSLVLDVKPGTSYRIGARLLRDRLDPESIRANAYWEPVVWAEVPERCR